MRALRSVGLAAALCLTASCGGGAEKAANRPAAPATVVVTTTAPPSEPIKPPKPACTLSDPDLFIATERWNLLVASTGRSDGPRYASDFFDYVSELGDDHDEEDCGGQDQLASLAYQAALLQAHALIGDVSQSELTETARVGSSWLRKMDFSSARFRA